jgi:nucleotide-binding universal stress UspA family protein
MIRTILVPIDGSDHAKKALKLACDLAGKYQAKMVLLHVYLRSAESVTLQKVAVKRSLSKKQRALLANYEADFLIEMAKVGAGYSFVSVPPPRELVEVIGQNIISRAEATANKAGIMKVTTVITDGDAADVIIDCAAKYKADMIVLGNRGLSDLKGFFLGSVSHKVSARAESTCVTVK